MTTYDQDEADEVRRDFHDAVTMAPAELEDWLGTDESKSVGQGSGESVGHESGRRIVALLRTSKDDLTESDLDHMRKVTGYVARHSKQRPEGGKDKIAGSNWRYSLMNWGNDPLK